MANGLSPENSCLYASLVVMVQYGNLHMIKVFLNGFMNMAEKLQLSDKSGELFLVK